MPPLVRRVAMAGAVVSLALLGLRPARTVTVHPADALLVTPGARPADVRRLADSLGVARVLALAGRDSLPDAGYVARHFGDARRLHVVGWGLDASQWRALGSAPAGLHLVPPPAGFTRASWPAQIVLGEELQVGGTVAGSAGVVSLADERGVLDSAAVDARGAFALRTRPAAVGRQRFVLTAAGVPSETIGVVVAPPPRWRTLIVTAAPSFDAAALRDLLGNAGAPVAWRAGISRGRARTEFVNRRAAALEPLREALLGAFDVLVMDGRALEALSAAERAAVLRAVGDSGLGLVLLAGDEDHAARRLGFAPLADTAVGERLVRPRTALGHTAASPVPAAPYALRDVFGAGTVLWGAAGDVLAQVMPRGAGRVVVTVVAAPSRWLRAGERREFATYWHALLGAAAGERPTAAWSVAGGRVGEPLGVVLRAARTPPFAVVIAPDGARDTVYLATDALERGRALGRYWPRLPGWHEIGGAGEAAGGAFFVTRAASWPARDAAERLAATARWAAQAPVAGPERPPVTTRRPIPLGWWLALFIVSCGVLWADRRRAYIRAMPRTAVAVLLVALGVSSCSKSAEERRNDVDRCAAINTQAELIALCLTTEHKWKDAEADSAARLRQHELDSTRTAQEEAMWRSDSARHRTAVRDCTKGNDVKECLLVRYGWPQERATRTADSAWQRNAAQHGREIRSCQRGRNPVASCLMLNYKWNAARAMATEDSLRRLRLR